MAPDTLERASPALKDPTLLRQQCYVNGQWIGADDGETKPVTNPANGAAIGTSPVFKGAEMVGAYGISGATGDQDEEIGRYAREKAGWAHMAEHDTTPESVKRHVNEIYAKVGLGDRSL